MSSVEFGYWKGVYEKEAMGMARTDLQFATVAAEVANSSGTYSENRNPSEYLYLTQREEEVYEGTVDEQVSLVMSGLMAVQEAKKG